MSVSDKHRGVVLHTQADGSSLPAEDMDVIHAIQDAAEVVHGVPFDERHDPRIIQACEVCHHFACICSTKAEHDEDCKYRKAVTCAMPIECEHGYDVCPWCDPCTCGEKTRDAGKRTPPHGDPMKETNG